MNGHNIPRNDARGECCIPCAKDNLEAKFFETLNCKSLPIEPLNFLTSSLPPWSQLFCTYVVHKNLSKILFPKYLSTLLITTPRNCYLIKAADDKIISDSISLKLSSTNDPLIVNVSIKFIYLKNLLIIMHSTFSKIYNQLHTLLYLFESHIALHRNLQIG